MVEMMTYLITAFEQKVDVCSGCDQIWNTGLNRLGRTEYRVAHIIKALGDGLCDCT